MRGVRGVESVYEKYVESIVLDTATLKDFKVDVGAMQYGFAIDAIVGMDILEKAKAIVNFYEIKITYRVKERMCIYV